MHFTASSHPKPVTAVMSSPPANVALSLRGACPAVIQLTKLHLKSNTSSQLEMRMLMTKLDSMLLLENTESYCNN